MGCGGCNKSSVEQVPPLATRGINLAKALGHWMLGGFPTTSDEQYEKRLEICRGCERLNDDTICVLCGCPVARKAALGTEKCPLNKWEGDKALAVISNKKCSHGSYQGHVFFDRKSDSHRVVVTAKCKLCSEEMLFKLSEVESGITNTLTAELVCLSDAGT